MAGNENSGGMRPTAPQNNPANISLTGGNGQSGQAMMPASGFAYGENKAINDQQAGAAMYKATPAANEGSVALPPLTDINAPTSMPDQAISHGMPFDTNTPGPDALNLPVTLPIDKDPSREIILALYRQNPRNEDLRYLVEGMNTQDEYGIMQ